MYMIFYLEELACYKQYLRGEMHTYTAMQGTLCHKHNSHIYMDILKNV